MLYFCEKNGNHYINDNPLYTVHVYTLTAYKWILKFLSTEFTYLNVVIF